MTNRFTALLGLIIACTLLSPTTLLAAGGNKKPSATPPFVIGEVTSEDPRLMDLSGDYEITSSTDNMTTPTSGTIVAFELAQDLRGRLAGSAQVTTDDHGTTTVALLGALQLSKQSELTFRVTGTNTVGKKPRDEDWYEEGSESGGTYQRGSSLDIRGTLAGDSFNTVVRLNSVGDKTELTADLAPENEERGFIIGETSTTISGKSDLREVSLPYGDTLAKAKSKARNGTFQFKASNSGFALDLRGTCDPAGEVTSITSAKLKMGYGSIALDPSDITITPVE